MDGQRRIPIHRALNRPNLLLGGERNLVLFAMLIAAIVCFTASSWYMFAIGIFIWMFLHIALHQMAKADPHMSQIYLRHIRYKDYYAARTGEAAPLPNVHDWNN